jgi:hypothetical protein
MGELRPTGDAVVEPLICGVDAGAFGQIRFLERL